MLTHRGFSAWLVSEGEQLREYLVAVDPNANRVSCWVPSEAGKSFSVHWKDEGSSVHSCSFIYLDGFVVPGRFLFGNGEASREGIRTGPLTERPFIFAEQPYNVASGSQSNRDIGTIVVKIKRVSLQGQKSANKSQHIPDRSGSQSNTLVHCIDFGDERTTFEQYPTTWEVKPYDESNKRSYVTFVFRYRCREFLLSQGIMTDDDGTAQQASLPVQKPRSAKRRVASAPVSEAEAKLITPSPTPSPGSRKKVERMSSSLKTAFNPGAPRPRPTNLRTVSMKGPGRNDRYPGEGILQFYSTQEVNTFGKGSEVDDESQKTLVGDRDFQGYLGDVIGV